MIDEPTKICPGCKLDKPENQFRSRSSYSPGAHCVRCLDCRELSASQRRDHRRETAARIGAQRESYQLKMMAPADVRNASNIRPIGHGVDDPTIVWPLRFVFKQLETMGAKRADRW